MVEDDDGGNSGSVRVLSSVELYLPETEQSCRLQYLPGETSRHSQEGGTVCGGSWPSCFSLNTTYSSWTNTSPLDSARPHHCSWNSPGGIILLGGEAPPGEDVDRGDEATGEDIDLSIFNVSDQKLIMGFIQANHRVR